MSRLDYLEWYNTQDVLIICPIIDFLIHQFQKYDIDMLRNISLRSCLDQVKLAMAYKDFDINDNYSQHTKTTFELTEEYFKKKTDNYNLQDTSAKRCILVNITMDDFNYFRDTWSKMSYLQLRIHFK
jgi:LPS O-antigen subunit length determinant protein (WzzB/FepE family)